MRPACLPRRGCCSYATRARPSTYARWGEDWRCAARGACGMKEDDFLGRGERASIRREGASLIARQPPTASPAPATRAGGRDTCGCTREGVGRSEGGIASLLSSSLCFCSLAPDDKPPAPTAGGRPIVRAWLLLLLLLLRRGVFVGALVEGKASKRAPALLGCGCVYLETRHFLAPLLFAADSSPSPTPTPPFPASFLSSVGTHCIGASDASRRRW